MKSKWNIALFVLVGLLVWPILLVLAQTPTPTPIPEPQSVDQALNLVQLMISAVKDGKWLVLAVAIVNLLVFAIKKWGNWLKIPSAWRVPVVTGLGLVVTILGNVISGGGWSAEWVLGFLAGPVAIWVHQLISRIKGTPEA